MTRISAAPAEPGRRIVLARTTISSLQRPEFVLIGRLLFNARCLVELPNV
jgi:hypothetical protein